MDKPKDLKTVIAFLSKLEKISSTLNVYATDDEEMSFNWFFQTSGFYEDRYFSFSFYKTRTGKYVIDEAHCNDISLDGILSIINVKNL